MTVRKMASTTMLWMKEFSTGTFNKISNRLNAIEFIQRNKQSIIVCLVLWLCAVSGGYLIFHSAVERLNNDFYQKGLSTTKALVEKVASPLLERDILSLSVPIVDISDTEDLFFATILDHADVIVAHTDTAMINQPFKPLQSLSFIDTIEGVLIETGLTPENKKIVGFSADVTYSGITIGKVYLAKTVSRLSSSLHKYRLLFACEVVFSFLLLSVVLLVKNHLSRKKAIKAQKEVEGMTRLGPYLLGEKIGQGGMAELFLADYVREDGFRKVVAIKKVLPHLVEHSDFIKMFVREARLAALLQHPNIVQIFDFGKIQNSYFIAMEYIRGKNLAQIMAKAKGGLPIDLCVFVILQSSMGLQFSHSKKDDKTGKPLNIIHRDISPQNILVSFQGAVKLSDFGISKARSEPSLTQAGVIKGKLSYLAPELALGKPADHQSDIYALGIVFYEILSGKRLYHFTTDIEAIRSIPKMEIVPIIKLRPEIPDELNDIVMKCLEKDKKKRYQSTQELHDDLMHLKTKLNMTFDGSDLSNFMKKLFGMEQ